MRVYDDLVSENWNDYVRNGEKNTINEDRLVFKKNVKIFSFKGDVLKMNTEYRFDT